ncbi:hypothetical protein ES708_21084 [subsurface metagenome]
MINKKILTLVSLLLVSFLLAGCWIFPINKAPEITSEPITTATVGVEYTYDVEAIDPDGDTLTYTLTTSPRDMEIDEYTGLITWTPKLLGNYAVTVVVSDEEFSVTQDFTIVVSAAPSDDATLKSLTVSVGTLVPGFASDTYLYDVELPYGTTEAPVVAAITTDFNATIAPIIQVSIPIYPGTEIAEVVVTAEDGVTELIYKVIFSVAAKVPILIIVRMHTITVDEPTDIEIEIVANDDVGTKVNGYFTLPMGNYEIYCEKWEVTLEPGTRYKVGTDEGYKLENTTLIFDATFYSVETYLMTLEVRTVVGDKELCSKDIEVVVKAASDAPIL